MRKKVAAVVSGAAFLGFFGATPAMAGGDIDNLWDPAACAAPSGSAFKFHLYYNSGQNGAYRNIGYNVYNFDVLWNGNNAPGGGTPLRYCIVGASNPLPGSNQTVKNNAASGTNDHYKYKARVHFRSGYGGPTDIMNPYQHIDRFRYVYNENASFSWAS
ncbi:hypothetical protein OG259_08945 [Streptomyces sp. NBC_00250]|uniref:hypothetical protein n=1 Tax=Streptomyces sp. NBC_00250 TaxID=2903641 RepID=UPI002E2A96AD|nr:hypothetical protein [Streptomyces sp. NBC_00250]